MKYVVPLAALAALGFIQEDYREVRAALERRYEQLAAANESRELAAVRTIRHESFHAVCPDGKIGGPVEMDDYSRQFFATVLPPLPVKFTIRSLTVPGDGTVAVAEVFQEVSRFSRGQRTAKPSGYHGCPARDLAQNEE